VPALIQSDPTRLRQILLNIVGNAIKFTESGKVVLQVTPDAVSSDAAVLQFVISDTGIGISDDKLAVVFEQFTQADSSMTRRYGGSGLGLTISKRLVELMGGHIWVESTVGTGSTFSFVMPFDFWAEGGQRAAIAVGAGPAAALTPLHILLVEDSSDNRTITVAYLKHTPYLIDIAENGVVACSKFRDGSYDLVLMDRQMPVMDGLTATRRIREWEQENRRAPTPIIALTASALKGDQEKCIAAGCTAFLTKPIKQQVLLQTIKDCSASALVSWQSGNTRLEPIRMLADAEFADLVPAFLRNCEQNVIAITDALDRDDFAAVEVFGHQMKGAGGSYGLDAITDIGEALERAAGEADAAAARNCVEQLSNYLGRVEIVRGSGSCTRR